MSAAVSRRKKWTQAAIIIGLMLLVGFIPPIDPITETGMQVLGIFLGCIYGWSLGEMVWPSILAMVLLGYVGENTVTAIFSAGFGDQNVLTVLFCMLMAYGIERSGFLNVITRWILSKKFATKGPWWLCFAFFTASAGASLICAPIAVSVLCWSLFFNVADVLKLRRYSSYVTVVMIGIAVSAYLGGIVRPYAGFAQACFGMLRSAAPDIVISYAAYSLTMFIITVFAVPLLALLCKALFRYKEEWSIPDKLFESKDDVIKLNKKQYLVLLTCPQ